MEKNYFGFALADSMFGDGGCTITRTKRDADYVRRLIGEEGFESCCNPSHAATIDALRSRYGIEVKIPEKPPRVLLVPGDTVIVMGVRGLPRLTDRHEYTAEEIAQATFEFHSYYVWEGAY